MERKNKEIIAGMMAGFCVLSTQSVLGNFSKLPMRGGNGLISYAMVDDENGLLVGNGGITAKHSSSLQAFGASGENALEDQHQEELDASGEENEDIVELEKKLDDLKIKDDDDDENDDVEILSDTNSCNGCHYELVDGEAILTIFSDRGMTEFTIPKYVQGKDGRKYKVTKMYTGGFVQCGNLEIINIPSTMTDIYSCDFYTKEDNGYWFNNENLKAINVDPDNHFYESVNGVLFLKNDKTLIKYPANKEGDTYKIPEGTKIIGDGAFYGSIHLISITMSGSEKIVDNYAFAQCSNLESINIPEGVTRLGKGALWVCNKLTKITLLGKETEIEENAFLECERLTTINIPEGVQYKKILERMGLGDKIVELDDIVDIYE